MLSRQEDSESLDLIFTVLKLIQCLVEKVPSCRSVTLPSPWPNDGWGGRFPRLGGCS